MTFKERCLELENIIKNAYESGVTLDEAERLAGNFLYAQMQVSGELAKISLDARMRKSGLKAIRAAIYLEESKKGDKKPTEAALAALVDANDIVHGEQARFDESEVLAEELERYYNIFQQAHVYFRQMSRGVVS